MEVLVALTILSLSLGVLFAAFSQSLARDHTNQSEMRARLLAGALLEQSELGPPYKPLHGETPAGLRWSLQAKPFGSSDDQTAWKLAPVELVASVAWGTRHSVVLRTLRLQERRP
jgi:hypothetical protein